MTAAPLAASVAASGSVGVGPRQSTPSGRSSGRWRDTTRTGRAQPGQMSGQGTPNLSDPEHDVLSCSHSVTRLSQLS